MVNPKRDPQTAKTLEALIAAGDVRVCQSSNQTAGKKHQINQAEIMLLAEPSHDASVLTTLLYGEGVRPFETVGEFTHIQAELDDYVGYVHSSSLKPWSTPSHRVVVPTAPVFRKNALKDGTLGTLPMGACVTLSPREKDNYWPLENGGFLHRCHVGTLSEPWANDPVDAALAYLEAPYVWGGRSISGLDCSGLIQQAFLACGVAVLRDTDMQEASIGRRLPPEEKMKRGDLVFFKGHVGIMVDTENLLHANAHHMQCVVEPLADVVARLEALGHDHPITSIRRFS